ncbi:MAG: MBL fold metallo-hydrolase [Gemmatimonadales bacterium]|nr:MBL fold metallo-hydrolase [Gemmatimonadales bacterium]
MIRFHILGAGGAVPTTSHTPAAYLVTVDHTPILLDPGPGAMVKHIRSGEAPNGVDDLGLVFVTHLHPDHCADLVPLLFALHSVVPQSTAPFALHGPTGLAEYLNRLREIYGSWLEPRRRILELSELAPGDSVPLPGGGSVESFAVQHPQDRLSKEALGYRFLDAAGHSAVFSGDTEPCPGLEEAARGADLLVVECSTPDELATPGHMTPTRVGELCAASRPRQVVLTHQYPAAAALDLAALVRRVHDCPVHQARDGSILTVPLDHSNGTASEKSERDEENR